jgi:formate dehydrogenase major subunit
VLDEAALRPVHANVEEVCGVPQEAFSRIADTFCRASGPDRTAAICYAVGWTQHSTGVQIIRTAAILQLLLGNIGRPGGGILALRGHASIQGSTEFHVTTSSRATSRCRLGAGSHLAGYIRASLGRGWWANFVASVSLLRPGPARRVGEQHFGFG